MPATDRAIHASMTIPLSITRSRTSIRLDLPGVRSRAMSIVPIRRIPEAHVASTQSRNRCHKFIVRLPDWEGQTEIFNGRADRLYYSSMPEAWLYTVSRPLVLVGCRQHRKIYVMGKRAHWTESRVALDHRAAIRSAEHRVSNRRAEPNTRLIGSGGSEGHWRPVTGQAI